MENWLAVALIYLVPVAVLGAIYMMRQRRRTHLAVAVYKDSAESGLLEPASLHPIIDPLRCLGCATCVSACPEKQVLGIVERRAKLIKPSSCIGHGACKEACPTHAIDLVFGTATRGVDIPHVDPNFQTNIAGVYIAGELGGMGLIRNAIEQGRQAIESIAKNGRKAINGQLDVVIVGAGPAGISAAMAAEEKGMSYRVMEQDTVGGTIAHYPRGKVVMTAPATLPIIGEFNFGETSKESLMEFWEDVVQRSGIKISSNTAVENITALDNGFRINDDRDCVSSNVLLAIGRRGTPRKLGVAGEEYPKVVYRLADPRQYHGQKVIVVGGGDSALEAALSLTDEPDVTVCLSYRGDAFNRVKIKNRERISTAVELGKLQLEMGSKIQHISPTEISLETSQGIVKLENDAVIICAGGILPIGLLRSIGVSVETRFGTAL